MKLMRLTFAAAFALAFTSAYAFHSGGVAECVGCHSMHSPAAGGSFLLVGTDQSSTCLTCHEHAGDTGPSSYHISTAAADITPATPNPKQRTPGGDFGWLRKTYTWPITNPDGTPGVDSEPGDHHGHNVIAIDNSYGVDGHNAAAPGGTFPAAQLACNSCHDPHGKYRRLTGGTIATTGAPIKASGSYNGAGNEPTATEAVGVYRLLAGTGYTKDGVTYTGVPAAKVPSAYNQSEATSQVRVAYGAASAAGHQTWGNWCGTCHPAMHSTGNYVHPIDQGLGSVISGLYNAYVKSGDMTGAPATAFSSLTPFVTNSADYPTLATLASNQPTSAGPGTTDQVSCLSCHRAHASAFPWGLRWQMEYEFMTVNSQYMGLDNTSVTGSRRFIQNRGRNMADNQAGYYDRAPTQFATWQRVLCNKCHAKD